MHVVCRLCVPGSMFAQGEVHASILLDGDGMTVAVLDLTGHWKWGGGGGQRG